MQLKVRVDSVVSPPLTIVTINRNNVAGLRKTFASVLQQTDRDFEYVVIDGASTDGSRDVIASTPGIDYWVSEPDDGVYDALNKGIERSSGEYLLFINSGDRLCEPGTVRKLRPWLSKSDIVYGNLKFERGGELFEGIMPDRITLQQMMLETLWHPAALIRRELFLRHGFYDTSFKICGDYDWFFNVIIDKGVTTRHIDQFIAIFALGGASSDIVRVNAERQRSQRKWLSERRIFAFWATERAKAVLKLLRRAAGRLRRRVRGLLESST